MMRPGLWAVSVAICAMSLSAGPSLASYAEYRLPDDVIARRAVVLSEGVPMIAHVVQARAQAGTRLPTIILCQGTGGLQHYHLPQAISFARAGFTAITFDYRGWGESRGRLIPADPAAPAWRDAQPHETQVVEVRETVDPYEQAFDVMALVAWAVAEPEVDAEKLGLWGTSLGASIAAFVTINEPRIRAAVLQVGPYDLRRSWGDAEPYRQQATHRAHGELPYPPPQPRVQGKLQGHLVREKYQFFSPLADISRLAARSPAPAILVVDAGEENLFDIGRHGQRLYEHLAPPKERVVISGIRHYDIYRGEALDRARRLATDWYKQHLQ